MNESKFFKILDYIEELTEGKTDVSEGYFPTVEELEAHKVTDNLELYLPMLTYFSNDPFAGLNVVLSTENKKEYAETVSYCKKVVSDIELTED